MIRISRGDSPKAAAELEKGCSYVCAEDDDKIIRPSHPGSGHQRILLRRGGGNLFGCDASFDESVLKAFSNLA